MEIVGGCYDEACVFPNWEGLYGSGMRAAIALSELASGLTLHSYSSGSQLPDFKAQASQRSIEANLTEVDVEVAFEYLHPLAVPRKYHRGPVHRPLYVKGDTVLGFGMVEGTAKIEARRAVYDPQYAGPGAFKESGSHAEELAVILNQREFEKRNGRTNDLKTFRAVLRKEKAQILVVKHGLGGGWICDGREIATVRGYRSRLVFRLGAGDVLAALFAYYWGEQGKSPWEAFDLASRGVAYYNDGMRLPIVDQLAAHVKPAFAPGRPIGKIFLPDTHVLHLDDRLLRDSIFEGLRRFGAEAIPANSWRPSMPMDVSELDPGACNVMFVVEHALQPIRELLEWGREKGLHTVLLDLKGSSHQTDDRDLEVTDDFVTAIYRALWAAGV